MSQSPLCLEYEELNPSVAAKRTIIWLHGLGADGHDFIPMVSQLALEDQLGIRYIFPHAPQRPVTLNMGLTMPAWFDIYSLVEGERQDIEGIMQAKSWVEALIENEIARGIVAENIMVGGFSQGGALALAITLQYQRRLAGCMALSCYLPIAEQILPNLSSANQKLAVFTAHGRQDALVRYEWWQRTRDFLVEYQYPTVFYDYEMAHSICHEEIQDMASWLRKQFETDSGDR